MGRRNVAPGQVSVHIRKMCLSRMSPSGMCSWNQVIAELLGSDCGENTVPNHVFQQIPFTLTNESQSPIFHQWLNFYSFSLVFPVSHFTLVGMAGYRLYQS